jgi:hypothetical protein
MISSATLVGVSALAGTINVSWTDSSGTGNWDTAGNWSDGVVPNNSNGTGYNVTLPSRLPNGSTEYYVSDDGSQTIDSLTVDANAGLVTTYGSLGMTGNIYVRATPTGCPGEGIEGLGCGHLGGPIHANGSI